MGRVLFLIRVIGWSGFVAGVYLALFGCEPSPPVTTLPMPHRHAERFNPVTPLAFVRRMAPKPNTLRTRLVSMLVTAYCGGPCCCGEFADGVTASGHVIEPGDKFAAAPKGIAFGTRMRIPGYNRGRAVTVLDRGGAIKGNKLDLYFDTHEAALQWGVKPLTVEILPK